MVAHIYRRFVNWIIASRSLTESPRAWFESNDKAYLVLNIFNVECDGVRLALPPDVIGVVFVYATRERAEARHPDARVVQVSEPE